MKGNVYNMLHETMNSMNTYEIISSILLLVSLVQPWVIKFFYHFQKIQISFIPSTKIRLFYNKSGAYIYIGGVIEAKNHSAIIKKITAQVIRNKDNAELNLDWSSFVAPVYQSIGGNAVATSEIARPFKIDVNSLAPIFVEFAIVNEQSSNKLAEIYKFIQEDTITINRQSSTLAEAMEKLCNSNNYKTFKDELLQTIFWQQSQYTLKLTIEYNQEETMQCSYRFALDSNEALEFRNNIEKLLQHDLNQLYGINTTLFSPQKDFSDDDLAC